VHILVSSAYPLSSPKGNSITAKRIASLLSSAGHIAEAINTDMPPAADVMIALHATKALAASRRFKTQSPNSKLIIYLTGTDLYKDQPTNNPEFFEALSLADTLVISQPASLDSIPNCYKAKTSLVPASVLLPAVQHVSPPPSPSIALVGHLRPVKNPFLMNQALAQLSALDVHAYTLGAALEPNMINEVNRWQKEDSRFKWLDDVAHAKTLSWMSQVNFTLNTSHSEGGSNAVTESIMLGTPVLASSIEGNVGLLGRNYLGYFEPGCSEELAKLINRALTDQDFSNDLALQIKELQPRFSAQKETDGWLSII
jgi:glycosyltransferase involved in cell wall biosynthesis